MTSLKKFFAEYSRFAPAFFDGAGSALLLYAASQGRADSRVCRAGGGGTAPVAMKPALSPHFGVVLPDMEGMR